METIKLLNNSIISCLSLEKCNIPISEIKRISRCWPEDYYKYLVKIEGSGFEFPITEDDFLIIKKINKNIPVIL